MIERGYFGRALQIVGSDPGLYVMGGLLLQILSLMTGGLLVGPAICGICYVTIRRLRGEEVTFADVFKGFDNFANALVAGVVWALMLAVGLTLFVVPGIILGALFCFVFPFIVDRDMPLPEALAASRRIAQQDLLAWGSFFLLALLVGVSGVILCVVGVMFTWPLMWATVAVAYEDVVGPGRRDANRSAS
ncbi:MAG TPA: hypothetical protein VFP98_05925 [Candidatus Polarisedimenticolia bacterium]|nr:hypothetical protein [Candidatus Polarisedimenticolia bacterium]